MEQFLEGLGFRVAEHTPVAVAIAAVAALAGLVLAVQAVRHRDDVREYRVLAVILGLGLAVLAVAGLSYVHGRADDACQRWARSADNRDELRYLEHSCEANF